MDEEDIEKIYRLIDKEMSYISVPPPYLFQYIESISQRCVQTTSQTWGEKIYDHIREFTQHYDYNLITDVLNKTEVSTYNRNIGKWTWDFVRAVVRRVENHRGIVSRERLHTAIKSVPYKKFIKDLCIKLYNDGLTYSMIADELNKHKYPRHLINTYTWSARSIGHIFDGAGTKRIKKLKDYVTYEE